MAKTFCVRWLLKLPVGTTEMPPHFEASDDRPVTRAFLTAIEDIDGQHVDFATAFRDLMVILDVGERREPSREKWAKNVLRTNLELRRQWRIFERNRNAYVLHELPAQELISLGSTNSERLKWQEQWQAAEYELPQGRMVALKSDPIWKLISAFGYPFPPFAYESSMGVRGIERDEAIRLGLLDKTTVVELIPIDRPDRVIWCPFLSSGGTCHR